jgi:hypothetical protein
MGPCASVKYKDCHPPEIMRKRSGTASVFQTFQRIRAIAIENLGKLSSKDLIIIAHRSNEAHR